VKDLIIAEDLNLTTSSEEIWGENTRAYPLSNFFKHLFSKNNLVDLAPVEVMPTWRNERLGSYGIEKHLDRFLVADEPITSHCRIRAWVDLPYLSDHAPICLQLGKAGAGASYPFKFNPAWLREDSFEQLVYSVWTDTSLPIQGDLQGNLERKLNGLKDYSKIRLKDKKTKEKAELSILEKDLLDLLRMKAHNARIDDYDNKMRCLEKARNKFLLEEEERWRLKSRALWIVSGDKNTRFFHRFTSHRRNKKFLW